MNFKKIFFIVALVSVNAGYAMVRPLADIAAPVALNTMLAAMDTPQRWVGVERNLDDERFGTNEVEKLTQALLRSGNIPWVLNKTLHHDGYFSILLGHVRSASFSPNGQRVVTASWDGTAGIWDVTTGQLIHTLQGHRNVVCAASFSPDGRSVVTASRDNTARIWDVATGQLVRTLQHLGAVNSASFSPNGRSVVTASDSGTARIWQCGFTDQSVDIKLQLKGLLLQTELNELYRRGQALRVRSLVHLYPIWETLPRNVRNDLVRQFPLLNIPLLNIRAAIEPTNYWVDIIVGGVGVAAIGAVYYWVWRKYDLRWSVTRF